MRSIRIILLVVTCAMALVFVGGCGKDASQITDQGYLGFPHWVDVYINDTHDCVTASGTKIEGNILLFEGDHLIINNTAEEKVTLTLPDGWFEEKEVTIEANKRKALKLLMKGPVEGQITSILRDITKDGTPNMKVGEEP